MRSRRCFPGPLKGSRETVPFYKGLVRCFAMPPWPLALKPSTERHDAVSRQARHMLVRSRGQWPRDRAHKRRTHGVATGAQPEARDFRACPDRAKVGYRSSRGYPKNRGSSVMESTIAWATTGGFATAKIALSQGI